MSWALGAKILSGVFGFAIMIKFGPWFVLLAILVAFLALLPAVYVWNPPLTGFGPSSAYTTCRPPEMTWKELADTAILPIDSHRYYHNYHGQTPRHLAAARVGLQRAGKTRFVYFAGDSSLDNKYWLLSHFGRSIQDEKLSAPAVGGYATILRPPFMIQDVAYWLCKEMEERLPDVGVINTAVEESTLFDRASDLLAQDLFIHDHITEDDYLVVSVGGNDLALRPSFRTAVNLLLLSYVAPLSMIEGGWAPGLSYFVSLFRDQVADYVRRIVAKKKPKKVVVCMLYFLDEAAGNSWADPLLRMLGYDRAPERLQAAMRAVYAAATTMIKIEGTEVVPLPIFRWLDGKDTRDYVQRVEPSAEGGRKMAAAIASAVAGQP